MTTDSPNPPLLSEAEVEDLHRQLTAAVRKICPYWLRDHGEDIVQVGLLRVMEVQRKSEDKRTFTSSYLWMTAYSAMVDEIRRHRRRGEVPVSDDVEAETSSPTATPERHAASRRLGRAIQDCLEQLVAPRRRALVLYLQGYAARQAARFQGWEEKQAKNLIFRGRQDLRACLEGKGYSV